METPNPAISRRDSTAALQPILPEHFRHTKQLLAVGLSSPKAIHTAVSLIQGRGRWKVRGEAPEQEVQCSKGRPGHRVPEMGQNLVSLQLARLPSFAVMLLNKLLTFLLFLLPRRAVEISQNPTVSRNLANPLVHAQLPGGMPLSHPRQREMMSSYAIPTFLLKPHGCLRVHCLTCHMGKEGHGPVCWGHMSNTQRPLMDAHNQHVVWGFLTLLHVGAPPSPPARAALAHPPPR